MTAVGSGSYYLGRPLRSALVARARAGKPLPVKFAGILTGGIVPEALALACVEWLGEPRLFDLLQPCDPPGISVDKLDAALRRHDTSLYEAKQDAHLRDDAGLERTVSRLLTDRGVVTVELVERILTPSRLGFDVFRTDPDLRRCYWTASANTTTSRRKVGRQKPMGASYPRSGRSQRDTRVARLNREDKGATVKEAVKTVGGNTPKETMVALRIDAGEILQFDKVALSLGLTRSQMLRQFVSQTVLISRAGEAVAA